MLSNTEVHFLDSLKTLLEERRVKSAGNIALRNRLKWDESTFFETKQSLIVKGYVSRGRGKGGSIQLIRQYYVIPKPAPAIASSSSQPSVYTLEDEVLDDLIERLKDRGALNSKYLSELVPELDISMTLLHEALSIRSGLLLKLNARGKNPSISLQDEMPQPRQSPQNDSSRAEIPFQFLNPFESKASELLNDLLHMDEIRALLPSDYKRTIDQIINSRHGAQARAHKIEYAQALMSIYGFDLLAQKPIRELLAKRKGIRKSEVPDSWKSGGAAAREFVSKIGFPSDFQGIPGPQREHHIHYPPKCTPGPLADYQLKAKDAMIRTISAPGGRAILRVA